MCREILDRQRVEPGLRGSVKVEIDGSKFGKRKCHTGRKVDEVLGFGGLNITIKRTVSLL